jgi:hypothetical protein
MALFHPHLTPAAATLLNDFEDQRIEAILSERWVSYPRAKHALAVLDSLVAHPRTTRMPSLAIYGDSGMGKTMIMQKFCGDHPPAYNTEANKEQRPVLALQMTGKPSERRFYGQLLAATGMPRSPRADIVDLEQSAIRILQMIGVKVLVIDEVHNILSGPHREQRVLLNTLRFLSNEVKMSLVCFGTNDAKEAISGDVQLARRTDELALPLWTGNEEFEALVASILRNLPLRNSSLLSARALRRMLQVAEGVTAKIFRILNELAVEAIKSGAERITDEAIESWRPAVEQDAAAA